jgi:phage-related tail fiber protein
MTSSFQDRLAGGANLGWKAPVLMATTADVTLSGLQTIDGVAQADGDRVLCKDQDTASENGIYLARAGAWERAPDWDGTGDAVAGTFVFVSSGTTNDNTVWNVTTSGEIVVGTTSVAFQQFSTLTAAFATQTEVNAGASAAVIVAPSTLAGRPSFSAHKNSTAQTGMTSVTDVLVTWSTEEWDTGSYFASNVWTPPAGKYVIHAAIQFGTTNAVDNEPLHIVIAENGVQYKRLISSRSGTLATGVALSCIVDANGTDTFSIYGRKGGAGDGNLTGSIDVTFFQGHPL